MVHGFFLIFLSLAWLLLGSVIIAARVHFFYFFFFIDDIPSISKFLGKFLFFYSDHVDVDSRFLYSISRRH